MYAPPVERWKDTCFIGLLLSAMSLIKFSTPVVWRLFEDKCSCACSGVLTRAKSERKVLMCQMPAPTWTSYFCAGVCLWERGGNWCEDNSCRHTAMPTHRHTTHQAVQCQRVCRDQLRVSLSVRADRRAARCSRTTGSELWTCPTSGGQTIGDADLTCSGFVTHATKLNVHTSTQTHDWLNISGRRSWRSPQSDLLLPP